MSGTQDPHWKKTCKSVEKFQMQFICGYFQAIKYVAAVEDQVRERLPFKKDIPVSVRDFIAEHKRAFFLKLNECFNNRNAH